MGQRELELSCGSVGTKCLPRLRRAGRRSLLSIAASELSWQRRPRAGPDSRGCLLQQVGSTVCEKTYCASSSCTAWLLTVGPTNALDSESLAFSKYIIIWGCNTISTNLHHWPFVAEACKKGAKRVVIDPYRSRTAKEADWHIAPKPGTDGALAMAMIQTIIAENLVDNDYVDK